MKYIGIVSRVEQVEGYETAFTGISEYYRNVLLSYSGVIPILILPPRRILYGKTTSFDEMKDYNDNHILDSLLDLCDGFLVPGGCQWFSYDEYIISYALRMDKPILGICLGMQIMAIVDNKLNSGIFDETLRVDNSSTHYQPGVLYAHPIKIQKGTQLSKILEVDTCQVNSLHHYCSLGLIEFVVSAYSDDGVIEAIEHPKKTFAIGVQWHPELMFEHDEIMKKLFDAFVSSVLTEPLMCL